MRRTASFALIFLAAACAESTDPQTILNHARHALTDLKSYEIQATNIMQTANADYDQTIKSKLVIASEQPGKFRVEAKGGGVTTVSNGIETWTYNSYLKQYTKTASGQSIEHALSMGPGSVLLPEQTGASVRSARLIREEDVAVEGSAHPCYLLEVEYEYKTPMPNKPGNRPSEFWIDKKTYLVLKRTWQTHIENLQSTGASADMKTIVTVESLKVGQPLPAELFSFTPPSTARLVDAFEYPGMKKPDFVGKQAADFTLRDLSDQGFHLASYRGKVVLLAFWATWCAPCRAEMPVLEKIHQENKDLVVLGIDVGEDMDVVQKFVKANNVTYPILLAGHDRVVNDYQAQALPTVVIVDKSGSIRTYKTGFGIDTETQLQAAVMDAAKPAPALAASAQQVSGPQISGSANGGSVYRIGNGVSAPNVLYKVEPAYSEEARKKHVSGSVVLSLVVSSDGTPRDIKVLRSLGYGLDEKAVEAVKTWKFRPAMKDGSPVAVQSTIEVNFRLLDGPNTAPPPIAPAPSISALSNNSNEPESEPQSAEEAYRRGLHLTRTRRLDEGMAMLNKAITLKPDWAQAYVARARAQVQQKRYNEAIKDYDQAIRLDGKIPSWYDSRGLAYSNSGRHARAIEDYTRAIELNPNSAPLSYINRGWAYTESGQPEKAVADLTKAVQIAPDSPRAYEYRALAYMRLENWKLAIADYTAGIQLYPTRWLYERRAEAKRASGDTAGAEEDLRRAAQMPVQQTAQSQ